MMARAAMPPATERPTIVPVGTELSWGVLVAEGEAEDADKGVFVTIIVLATPWESVDTLAEVTTSVDDGEDDEEVGVEGADVEPVGAAVVDESVVVGEAVLDADVVPIVRLGVVDVAVAVAAVVTGNVDALVGVVWAALDCAAVVDAAGRERVCLS
jgi:hypothetical protein